MEQLESSEPSRSNPLTRKARRRSMTEGVARFHHGEHLPRSPPRWWRGPAATGGWLDASPRQPCGSGSALRTQRSARELVTHPDSGPPVERPVLVGRLSKDVHVGQPLLAFGQTRQLDALVLPYTLPATPHSRTFDDRFGRLPVGAPDRQLGVGVEPPATS